MRLKNRFVLLNTVAFKALHGRQQLVEFSFRLGGHVRIEHAAALIASDRGIILFEFPERIREPIERESGVVDLPCDFERLAAHLHFVFVVVFHEVRSSRA